ncbi:hypothetical protein DKX38_022975 [Salix brachista]|uniref:RCC1-like domain-containing protein n=1 Tax=Salix brachista TaxID=2182728 RepID=A0A5N5K2Q1_9ROSI|nr:hypothetical protein DKX38_022975 [Salix brachista]
MEEAKRDEEESKQQQIWSWGAGTEGQLGTGKLEDEYLPQLLHLPFLSSAGSISTLACGGAHAIALTSVGKVFTWGRGTTGQLGHGEMLNSLHPKPVSSLQSYVITHVSAGWSHSGFVSDIGLLFTCGDGSFGQLGLGDYRSQSTPVKVDYFANNFVNQIACGMRHSLVMLKGNQVYGFGSGKRGQLGSRDKIKSCCNICILYCNLCDLEKMSVVKHPSVSTVIMANSHVLTWGWGEHASLNVYCENVWFVLVSIEQHQIRPNHMTSLPATNMLARMYVALADSQEQDREAVVRALCRDEHKLGRTPTLGKLTQVGLKIDIDYVTSNLCSFMSCFMNAKSKQEYCDCRNLLAINGSHIFKPSGSFVL